MESLKTPAASVVPCRDAAWLRHAIEDAPIPAFLMIEDGGVAVVNRALLALAGRNQAAPGAAEPRLERVFGPGAAEVRAWADRGFAANEAAPPMDVTVGTEEGEARLWRLAMGALARLSDGRRCLLAVVTDLTREQQQTQRAVEGANAARARFLAAASHELRQPLQAIDIQRRILARKNSDPEVQGIARELGAAIDRMRDSLDALLDLGQLEAGAIKPESRDFPVREVFARLADAFRDAALAKGLRWRMVPSSALAHGDPRLVEGILHGLLAAALRSTTAGGILLGCRSRGGKLRLEVHATGPGMTEAARRALLDQEERADPLARLRDLGLGLAAVRAAAGLAGAVLDLRAIPGKGSAALVTIAAGICSAGQPADGSAAASLLVVEDDPLVAGSLRRLLELEGYAVSVAASGPEATAQLRTGSLRPRLAIVDQSLPGDMAGVEVVQALRALGQRPLPALILTGDVASDNLAAIAAAGLPVLRKPIDADELIAAIKHLLDPLGRDAAAAPATAEAPAAGEHAEAAARLARLTPRERAVVELIAQGCANKEVAFRLKISPRTVEAHRLRAMQKLQARSLAELVRLMLAVRR